MLNSSPINAPARYAIIIPARDEEPCLRAVLQELKAVIDPAAFEIVVGVNASTDRTAEVARGEGVLVAETPEAGYGHGCQAAIDLLEELDRPVAGYIFLAADGANDPRGISRLLEEHARGFDLVLGSRTFHRENLRVENATYIVANRLLGLWCGLLTGRIFTDLGPLRLISRRLFGQLQLREWTYGWTIEAQIRAVRLGATITEVPVRERPRIAGVQKVSRVSLGHTLEVGRQIFAAGWRARRRSRG